MNQIHNLEYSSDGNHCFSCSAAFLGTLFSRIGTTMLNSLRCSLKGHIFVDSRSQPGMQTCVRCRTRQPFERLRVVPSGRAENEAPRV
ncbi:MAG: hypothetical protein EON87_05360 [Brevundimonas sp.]|nr:MAG: hypothetical protein EON87_05360 [Brevundimonas sp.]